MNKTFFNLGMNTANLTLDAVDLTKQGANATVDLTKQGANATKDAGQSFWAGIQYARTQRSNPDDLTIVKAEIKTMRKQVAKTAKKFK